MNCVQFKVNGLQCTVRGDVSSTTTLLEYLRVGLELRGTKYMCMEGGCGACIVSVVKGPASEPQAVNSCLVSITSCQNWEITTIEDVGNRLKGYHPLQVTLAETNGSQCGYCSPGWIMSMYSLLKSKPTMLEIERSLSSNMCRCTGYRSILEAFRKFASDAPGGCKISDIEDLHMCKHTKDICSEKCKRPKRCSKTENSDEEGITSIKLKDGRYWFGVVTVADVFNILRKRNTDSYMLVGGNTAKGVMPIIDYPKILIDISRVTELKGYYIDRDLVVGAGNTLTEFLENLKQVSNIETFEYLSVLVDHLQLVAHVAVRNLGTIAGNLMLKHQNNKFSSDIFLLLQGIEAQLTLALAPDLKKVVSLESFLTENMIGKLILNILIPPLSPENRLVTYKISARSRNAHAIVNAAFLFNYKSDCIVRKCRIVFGGLSPKFSRARNTEQHLIGKDLFINDTLQTALHVLSAEVLVEENLPEPSAKYRKQVALGLFYKALLSLYPETILHPRYRSGAGNIHESRPISKGSQVFETEPNTWPLTQPVQKTDALIQCAGESKYVEDSPSIPGEVFAAFVLSTALGTIQNIDASEAIKQPGVVAFYTAKDIPGVNSFTSANLQNMTGNEEILCSGNVLHCNQPIGIIVGETHSIANRAALKVKVEYSDVRKPEVDIKHVKNLPEKYQLYRSINATDLGDNIVRVIKGENTVYGQSYFCLETMNCISKPTEDGLELLPSTHYIDGDHMATAQCLDIDASRIEVKVKRLGGSFGVKLSRQSQITAACSLVAYKLNRPCRFILPLRTQTRAVGKRMPASTNYEVGVNADGVVQYLNYDIYNDNGCQFNETVIEVIILNYYNCYNRDKWNFKCHTALTDTPSNTWMRCPGSVEAISATEMIMERISYELDLDPLTVRLNNLDKKNYNDLAEMLDNLKHKSDYTERRDAVNKFNMENRWRKRGLRFTVMKWEGNIPFIMHVTLSVYHGDGSIAITHGGVEVGQGINTKAKQICAYFLDVPLDKIHIKETDNISSPNNYSTAASITSQNVALGVRRCCEELLKSLEHLRVQMNNPTWEPLVAEAYRQGINLKTNSYIGFDDTVYYNVYGVTLAEVEVDILTGQSEILRVDLLEDVGCSLSPHIDIGQVEGAFVMGVGYWTTEELIYDQSTGELLTDRSWNYHVPLGTDTPQDFRIYFTKKTLNNDMILGSKALGEPPLCMGVVIPLAMREAIVSARSDGGIPSTEWFQIDGPYTIEKICIACDSKIEDFKFY